MTDNVVHVADTGFTCLYPGGANLQAEYAIFAVSYLTFTVTMANDDVTPSVVFVHGLGGHPRKTWSTERYQPKVSADGIIPTCESKVNWLPKILRRTSVSPRQTKKRQNVDGGSEAEEQSQPMQGAISNDESAGRVSESSVAKEVFWPRDLLPMDVKDVRVMTFGYYSNPGHPSQDNLYTLSKNLLGRLVNERTYAVSYIRVVWYRREYLQLDTRSRTDPLSSLLTALVVSLRSL